MGRDGLRLGVRIIRKFVIRPVRICYRLVYQHPFVVGISLLFLFLYRSSPLLFSLFVSASPILVCTAILLGTLLSFGEHSSTTAIEEDEEIKSEFADLRTVVDRDESYDKSSGYIGLRGEIIERSFDEEPLLYNVGRIGKSETNNDLGITSMPTYNISREIKFEEQSYNGAKDEFESLEICETVCRGDQFGTGVEVGVNCEDVLEDSFTALRVESKDIEDNKSVEELFDLQTRDHLESTMELEGQLGEVARGTPPKLQEVHAESLVNDETDGRSINSGTRDEMGSSSESWAQFDVFRDRFLSTVPKIQVDSGEDYISAEGSLDAQIGSPLELSLGSWNHMDSDQDGSDVSDSGSGSDGAESSSPDASMADIIPMLDELHPLLEDESLLDSSLSRKGSVTAVDRSTKSIDGSIHSDDESEEEEEEDAGDIKSDGEDDNGQGTQDGKDDPAKSPILWTEDDQKNLMDLGTSELERNHRLESLIARRRSRRMMTDKNLIDLEGMDLQFSVPPISTSRYNPFDNYQDSYAGLGLPPIPGSAPSVMLRRRNPFDLPYDSSEEKPDLTGDSFQEEFMELTQRESSYQREALFKRNETFSMGSSMFDFGRHMGGDKNRASRFRPYFIPERTDSDVMSHSSFQRQYSDLSESRTSIASLQRQSSELSESKASSIAEMDSILADLNEKTLAEHHSSQEMELRHNIEYASVEHGSQSSEDMHSVSDEENEETEVEPNVPGVKMVEIGETVATSFHPTEAGDTAENSQSDENDHSEAEYELSDSEDKFAGEPGIVNLSSPSIRPTLSFIEKDEDLDMRMEKSQVYYHEVSDNPVGFSLETSVSDIQKEHSQEDSEFSLGTKIYDSHPKEPVYDSSPLAMKKNLSSSSISSDLQRQSSDIDLYHVQRDLFAAEDSKDHDAVSEQNDSGRRHETDGNRLAVNNVTEVSEHMVTESCFPEIDLQQSLSPGSFEGKNDVHLSKHSPNEGLLLNDTVSPHERELETQGDKADVYHKYQFETSVDAMPLIDGYKSSEVLNSEVQENQAGILREHVSPMSSNLFSSEVESEELEIKLGSQLFPVPVSNLNQSNDDGSTMLLFTSDDTQSSPLDSTHDSEIQEPSITSMNLEDIGLVNKVDETAHVLEVQEPEACMRSNPLEDDESSSRFEELEKLSVPELLVEKRGEDMSEIGFSLAMDEDNISSKVDMPNLYEEDTDLKELDEGLLSELDAVSDFGVNKTPYVRCSYPEDTVYFEAPVEVSPDLHSSSAGSFDHGILLNTADIQNSEPVRVNNESNLSSAMESVPDAHINAGATSLVVGDQSVLDEEQVLKKVSEEDVQEYVTAESSQAKPLTEEVEPENAENKAAAETVEPIGQAAEVLSLFGRTSFERESSPGKVDSVFSSLEERSIDSNRMELKPDISVYNEALESAAGDFEGLKTDVNNCNAVEVPQTTADIVIGNVEFQESGDIKDIKESRFVETSIASLVHSEDQLERFYSVDSKFFHSYIDAFEKQPSSELQSATLRALESVHHMERVDSVGSESVQNDSDVNEGLQLPVPEGAEALTLESEDHRESVAFVKYESVTMDATNDEIHASPDNRTSTTHSPDYEDQMEIIGSTESESLPLDISIEVLQGSFPESTDQIQRISPVESGELEMDGDVQGIQKHPATEASISSTVEPGGQRGICTQIESIEVQDLEHHNVASQPLPKEYVPETDDCEGDHFDSSKSEDQTKVVASVESEELNLDEDVKMIQENPAVISHTESSVNSKDQMEIYPQMDTPVVQDLGEQRVESQQQPEDFVQKTENFIGCLANSSQSTTNERVVHGSSETASDNSSSQVEERSHESHLDLSSSSSSSSSSNDSDEGYCIVQRNVDE